VAVDTGVGVAVGVAVADGVDVSVNVEVGLGVAVSVGSAVGVSVGLDVGTSVDGAVTLGTEVVVATGVDVSVGTGDDVAVGTAVDVSVAVGIGAPPEFESSSVHALKASAHAEIEITVHWCKYLRTRDPWKPEAGTTEPRRIIDISMHLTCILRRENCNQFSISNSRLTAS